MKYIQRFFSKKADSYYFELYFCAPIIRKEKMSTTDFAKTLLEWYRQNGRDLPWRAGRNPYTIWISEIILQQTRVAQGLDYYRRFVERFPDVDTLAQADESEVLKYWEGLGYYSRARNLHQAARQVMQRGAFPRTFEEIRALKGVGDYTAAAIASFAYSLPHAVVDGNVYRVLSRYLGMDCPIDTVAGRKAFALAAQELLDKERAADYNQAIMDFGALQCVPRNPQCSVCPLVSSCVAYREGRVAELPVKQGRQKLRSRYFTFIYIEACGRLAFWRRPAGDIWSGLCQPLLLEWTDGLPDEATLRHRLSVELKCATDTLFPVAPAVRQRLSHQQLHASFYGLRLSACPDADALPPGVFWADRAQLKELPFPKMLILEKNLRIFWVES